MPSTAPKTAWTTEPSSTSPSVCPFWSAPSSSSPLVFHVNRHDKSLHPLDAGAITRQPDSAMDPSIDGIGGSSGRVGISIGGDEVSPQAFSSGDTDVGFRRETLRSARPIVTRSDLVVRLSSIERNERTSEPNRHAENPEGSELGRSRARDPRWTGCGRAPNLGARWPTLTVAA